MHEYDDRPRKLRGLRQCLRAGHDVRSVHLRVPGWWYGLRRVLRGYTDGSGELRCLWQRVRQRPDMCGRRLRVRNLERVFFGVGSANSYRELCDQRVP